MARIANLDRHGPKPDKAATRLSPHIESLPMLSMYLCIGFLFSYLLILPSGVAGYALAVIAFLAALKNTNRQTLAAFCLLSGPTMTGIVFQSLQIASVGSIVSIGIGFTLLVTTRQPTRFAFKNWKTPALWLLLTTIVLFFFYLAGPQTEYSETKLKWFFINILLNLVVISLVASDHRVNLWRLGFLSVISSAVYCAALFYIYPNIMPGSFLETAGIRNMLQVNNDVEVATNTVAVLASNGIVLIAGSLIDTKPRINYLTFTALIVVAGLLVLNLVGQRLFLVAPILAVATLIFCNPREKKLFTTAAALLLFFLIVVIAIGLQTENHFITSMFTPGADIDERLNRTVNWVAAIDQISENPWLGSGLGGYYVPGYSVAGEGTYAHNLLLELLSETGIIGATLILVPPLVFLIFSGRRIYQLRTAGGGSLTAFLALEFMHAMISHDLRQSALLFATIAVIWARPKGGHYARK